MTAAGVACTTCGTELNASAEFCRTRTRHRFGEDVTLGAPVPYRLIFGAAVERGAMTASSLRQGA